jgi:hypothetical protein
MKKILIFLFFISTVSYAQKLKGFGSVKIFLDTQLSKSGFANGGIGIEYKINKKFRPEIELSGFLGSLPIIENTNTNGLTTDILKRSFTAINVSFCPKIGFGNDEDNAANNGFFQIIPIYSITKIESIGTLTIYDTSNKAKPTEETRRYIEIKHNFGLGIGYYINLSEKTSDAIAINLYYLGINFGNSLTNLKFSQGSFSTKDAVGLGINYYFGFSKK